MTFNGTIVDGGTTYSFNGRLKNKIGHGYSPLDGFGFINAEAAVAAALPTPGVVSRKTHGTAGDFDISLPFNGKAGIECRSGGPGDSYTLVYTFDRPLRTTGTATVTQGSATVSSPAAGQTNPRIGSNPNQVIVNLNNVANAQHLVVTLSGMQDTSGNTLPSVAARMDVLLGDIDASGRVDSTDVFQARQKSLQNANSSNFRTDVDDSGRVDSNDVFITRQQSLTSLP